MKVFLPLLALALITASANAATSVVFTWTSGNSSLPACSATVTTNCVSGYTLTDTTTSAVLATPSTLNSTSTTFTYTPAGGLYFGTQSFSLVANGFDGSGKALVSSAANTSVTNNLTTLAPPNGFSGSVQ